MLSAVSTAIRSDSAADMVPVDQPKSGCSETMRSPGVDMAPAVVSRVANVTALLERETLIGSSGLLFRRSRLPPSK
jgi:hypothetical protein